MKKLKIPKNIDIPQEPHSKGLYGTGDVALFDAMDELKESKENFYIVTYLTQGFFRKKRYCHKFKNLFHAIKFYDACTGTRTFIYRMDSGHIIQCTYWSDELIKRVVIDQKLSYCFDKHGNIYEPD